MLRPKNVNQYCDELKSIVGDLMTRLDKIATADNESGDGCLFVKDLPNELYKWSLECEYKYDI